MNVSVVIPLFNENESLPELTEWIVRVMRDNKLTYEIIFVDDGSTDDSWKTITLLAQNNSNIKGIRFRRNYGKSAALHCGFQKTTGDVVITMDADLQDSPDEIPALYNMVVKEQFDLISGWKKLRYDPISKTLPSRFFNRVARWQTGIKLHDFNCGLKAYRADVIKSIEVYGEMHRYMPVLAKQAGFKKIGEKVVTHYERKYGKTKFGIERFVNGFLDLISIMFISKFGKKPMHFFGTLGIILFILGFFAAALIGADKLYALYYMKVKARLVTDNPYFFISLTCMIIGSQLFLAGFVGELISRNSSDRNHYIIANEL